MTSEFHVSIFVYFCVAGSPRQSICVVMNATVVETGTETEYPTLEMVLRKCWWTTVDVAVYLNPDNPKLLNTRTWMTRNKVRRSKTNRFLTCREWVDAALTRTRG